MTITYDWQIANLEYESSDGFVFTVHWTVNAVDSETNTNDPNGDSYSAKACGSIGLSRHSNLIPYESLTEEIVMSWTKEKLGEISEEIDPKTGLPESQKSELQKIEENLAAQIAKMKSSPKKIGVPWDLLN